MTALRATVGPAGWCLVAPACPRLRWLGSLTRPGTSMLRPTSSFLPSTAIWGTGATSVTSPQALAAAMQPGPVETTAPGSAATSAWWVSKRRQPAYRTPVLQKAMPCRHGLFFVCRSDRTTALTEFPFRAASMESDERLDRRLGQTGGRRYWHPVNARLVICEAN